MRKFLPREHGRLALHLAAACAVAALMAGCSTDSTRLSDPFSSPFSTSSNEQAPAHVADAMPAGRMPPVSSRSLAAPSHVATVAPLRPNLTRSASLAPISHETTGSIEPAPVRSARGGAFGGWTSNGGVPITVGEGETVDVISKRYGVPSTALLATNGLSSPSDIRPGSNLTIPVYSAVAAAAPAAPARVAVAAPSARASLLKPKAERVAAAQTREQVRAEKAAAKAPAEKIARGEPPHPLRLPPPEKVAAVAPPTAAVKPSLRKNTKPPAIAAAAPAPAPAPAAKAAPVKAAVAKPVVAPAVAQATPAKAETAPAATTVAPQAVADASGNPEFRWPARGRIIQGFKGGNDGINIALPDGTPIKAAEGGTVAYAGSELKGYGNLVLIRHPNGFVSAYANNGEIDVKRGDQVKRGQIIAKSGQSGNVSSPQLHFELRKGSTPVDPTTYLAGL